MQECWQDDPALRPCFMEICNRLSQYIGSESIEVSKITI